MGGDPRISASQLWLLFNSFEFMFKLITRTFYRLYGSPSPANFFLGGGGHLYSNIYLTKYVYPGGDSRLQDLNH